jgi:excisionase family DNA binding protein
MRRRASEFRVQGSSPSAENRKFWPILSTAGDSLGIEAPASVLCPAKEFFGIREAYSPKELSCSRTGIACALHKSARENTPVLKFRKEIMWMEEIMTPSEVAALLKIHLKTVYKLAEKGVIPGNRIGRSWRFSRSDVLELVSSKSGLSDNGDEESPITAVAK